MSMVISFGGFVFTVNSEDKNMNGFEVNSLNGMFKVQTLKFSLDIRDYKKPKYNAWIKGINSLI